jgi:competence protein CoiA
MPTLRLYYSGHGYWKPSEQKPDVGLGPIRSRRHIEASIISAYKGHHFFVWKYARCVWPQAERPVFLDFGNDDLYWLQKYTGGEDCIQKIPKDNFIKKHADPNTINS